jgi:hypothetical protein
MGLWLKCPGCQAQNPLSLKVCPHCGRDLDKLPAAQRVYVMGPTAVPPPAKAPAEPQPAAATASRPSPPPSEAGTASKPAKKRTTKKKK